MLIHFTINVYFKKKGGGGVDFSGSWKLKFGIKPKNSSLTEEVQVRYQWVNAVTNKEVTKAPLDVLKEMVDVT